MGVCGEGIISVCPQLRRRPDMVASSGHGFNKRTGLVSRHYASKKDGYYNKQSIEVEPHVCAPLTAL